MNATNNARWTALYYAAHGAYSNVTAVLLANGAEANPKGTDWTPLLGRTSGFFMDRTGYKDVLPLLKYGNVNAKANDGWSPLHHAARFGRVRVVEILLANGADVDARNKSGMTPLQLAATYDQPGDTKLLIGAKANLLVQDRSGSAPLHLACGGGHEKVVAVPIGRQRCGGANRDGAVPLHLAANAAVAQLLIARERISTPGTENWTHFIVMAVGRTSSTCYWRTKADPTHGEKTEKQRYIWPRHKT